jgi:hypothetical protein
MQVCQDLLNHYEAEGDSFLDRIITGDETWCHQYEPESKRQSMSGESFLDRIITGDETWCHHYEPLRAGIKTTVHEWRQFPGSHHHR